MSDGPAAECMTGDMPGHSGRPNPLILDDTPSDHTCQRGSGQPCLPTREAAGIGKCEPHLERHSELIKGKKNFTMEVQGIILTAKLSNAY